MSEFKYKVGDRIKIKSLDWYNQNKDEIGDVDCGSQPFIENMIKFCGKTLTISQIDNQDDCYFVEEDDKYAWTDDMIEGLVEEETKPKPKFKVGDKVKIKGTDIRGTIESRIRGQLVINNGSSIMIEWPENVNRIEELAEEKNDTALNIDVIEKTKEYWDSIKDAWICPEGYQFKDENGNVINTTKIVLEKKKKEYPKTFLGCCDVLGIEDTISRGVKGYKSNLLDTFQKLLICRDAYWKIAGEEMGLGKPWEPDWTNNNEVKFIIGVSENEFITGYNGIAQYILAFPTEEMRDVFYDNFKELIEQCKELL